MVDISELPEKRGLRGEVVVLHRLPAGLALGSILEAVHLRLYPVPEYRVGGGGELVPLPELDEELPLPRPAARGLPRRDADQVLQHVRVEDGAAQRDDAVDELQKYV